jgi:hypothetical protein
LYDEYEELDEVDESKDKCGGVAWCQYVLKQPRSSNKVLHQLAREVRGLEKKRGSPASAAQRTTVKSCACS